MISTTGPQPLVLVTEFEEEFKAWFADGVSSTVLYVVAVLAVIAIVLKATS